MRTNAAYSSWHQEYYIYTCNLLLFQSLDPELEAQLGKIKDSAPKYSIWTKVKVVQLIKHLHVCVLVTIASSLALSPSPLLPSLSLSLSPFLSLFLFLFLSLSLSPPFLPLGASWFDAQDLFDGQTC